MKLYRVDMLEPYEESDPSVYWFEHKAAAVSEAKNLRRVRKGLHGTADKALIRVYAFDVLPRGSAISAALNVASANAEAVMQDIPGALVGRY